jgi:hypothetical protein
LYAIAAAATTAAAAASACFMHYEYADPCSLALLVLLCSLSPAARSQCKRQASAVQATGGRSAHDRRAQRTQQAGAVQATCELINGKPPPPHSPRRPACRPSFARSTETRATVPHCCDLVAVICCARPNRAHADRARAARARAYHSRVACCSCVRCSCVRCSCVRCSCVGSNQCRFRNM